MVTDCCVNNVEHVFEDTSKIIPVVFATDKNFIPYLYVAIQSLVDNSSENNNYDVVILCTGVDEYRQKQFKQLEKKNISIRFFDMADLMAEYKDIWYTHWQYTDSVYYRFFIPQIFSTYNKILFLDADIIVNCDVSELYNVDLEGYSMGACVSLVRQNEKDWHKEFIEQKLGMTTDVYFNAGVFLLDISKISTDTFVGNCIQTLLSLNNPPLQDQDVLNYLFKGKVSFIHAKYNFTWNLTHSNYIDSAKGLEGDFKKEFQEACDDPKIIHFIGNHKPWKYPSFAYAEYFWKYARKTPFYEGIIYKNCYSGMGRKSIYNVVYRRRIYLQYLRCKLLKLVTFGKKREHYSSKALYLKNMVRDYRKTLQK